jgi:hypothetical protein
MTGSADDEKTDKHPQQQQHSQQASIESRKTVAIEALLSHQPVEI